jgi:hypothetical protein
LLAHESESAAMWKIYSTAKESVYVQTSYARLRDALAEDVHIGIIRYISYERDKIPASSTFWPLTHKRESFEHERELSAVWSAIHRSARPAPLLHRASSTSQRLKLAFGSTWISEPSQRTYLYLPQLSLGFWNSRGRSSVVMILTRQCTSLTLRRRLF